MTQPPDDAALVARLRDYGHNGCRSWLGIEQVFFEAATALEAKDRRIAEMGEALTKAAAEFDLILMRLKDGQDERAAGAAICGAKDARAALEPSDKGVGR